MVVLIVYLVVHFVSWRWFTVGKDYAFVDQKRDCISSHCSDGIGTEMPAGRRPEAASHDATFHHCFACHGRLKCVKLLQPICFYVLYIFFL